MATVFITFILVTAIYLAVTGFLLYRVANHLRGNEEGTKAVVKHVLIPLLGRARVEESEPEAEEVAEVKPVATVVKPAKEVF